MRRFVQRKLRRPIGMQLTAASAEILGKMLAHAVRHQELLVFRPAVGPFGQADFLVAQRRAVRFVRIGFVRRAESDHGSHHDQRGTVLTGAEGRQGSVQGRQVVRIVDRDDVPAQPGKPHRHVFAERQIRVAFDRDSIVIVDPTQIRQLQMPRYRRGFAANAFHQIPVAAQRVHVVAEQVKTRLVIAGGKPLPGHRHADAATDALAQWPGRHLDPRRVAILGMPGTRAAQLAKIANVVQRNRRFVQDSAVLDLLDARQVQHRIQQHRGVPAGQDKPIPGRPPRMLWIITQMPVPDRVGHRSQRHGRSRMTAVRLLDSVHRQSSNRIDCQLLDVILHNCRHCSQMVNRQRSMRPAAFGLRCDGSPPNVDNVIF